MKKTTSITIILICLLLTACFEEPISTRPSIISDNTTRTTIGEFEWHYFESPDKVCYQVLIMVDRCGYGYMAMSRVPHSFCEKQTTKRR